jgi:DNA mismatch repair protein MutS
LFATHYHELIQLSDTLPGLANAHLAVENEKNSSAQSLRFLYELKEGPTNDSFGIQVAQMAGLPKSVIDRAWTILGELESSATRNPGGFSPKQLSLFDAPPAERKAERPAATAPEIATELPKPHPILEELKAINLNDMTPMQAMTFLMQAQAALQANSAPNS